jgi:tetratricopeptide (TPR) repeat protein
MSDLLQTALAAHQAGRWEEAETLYRRILSQTPQDTRARQLLGRLALQRGQAARSQGNLPATLLWLQQALELDPQLPEVYNDLAIAHYANKQIDPAIATVGQALQRWPEDHRFHGTLGYLLASRGNHTAAVTVYREAIRLRPNHAEHHALLGLVLIDLGDLKEARLVLEEALRLDPKHPEALAAVAQILREQMPEVHQVAGQEVLKDKAIPLVRRGMLGYALAQVHDARQEYARVVELIEQARACFLEEARQRGRSYTPAGHKALIDQIMTAYQPAHFERVRGWGSASELPVFIFGLPRSGTSLAEQILASHPQVFGAGEQHVAGECSRLLPTLVGRCAPSLACLGYLTQPAVAQLAQHYLNRLRTFHATADRIVDKLPDNYQHLGLIATLFPQARLIHVRRDLRDVALSCWMTAFRSLLWPLQVDHIRERFREYLRLMEHWRRVLPVPLLEIDYEDLVEDTEAVARRLVAWCGLSWDPACRTPHQTRRVVVTASKIQVRQPVFRRSLGRWKSYQELLGPLFAAVGDLIPSSLGAGAG